MENEKNEEKSKPERMKMRKSRKIIMWVCIGVGATLTLAFIGVIVFIVILVLSPVTSKITTFEDPSDYDNVFVEEYNKSTKEWQVTHDEPFDMIPSTLTGEITEFSYTYYNPWDAQYLLAMRVSYTDEAYQSELQRLESFGIDEFEGIYSVTGEAPSGYEIIAMEADFYSGFSYAIVPTTKDNTIVYVVIDFCNYFLDLDIHKYFPDQYLLPGFNAEEDNPYKEEMYGKAL